MAMDWQDKYWSTGDASKDATWLPSVKAREDKVFTDTALQKWAADAAKSNTGYRKVLGPSNNYYAVYPDGTFYPLFGNQSLKDVIASGQDWKREGYGVTTADGKRLGLSTYAPEGSGGLGGLGSALVGGLTGGLSGGLTGATGLGNVLTGQNLTDNLGTAAGLDAAGLAAAAGGSALLGPSSGTGAGSLGGAGEFAGLEGMGGTFDAANLAGLEAGDLGSGLVAGAGSGPSVGGLGGILSNLGTAANLGLIGGSLMGVLGSNQKKNEQENIAGGIAADRKPYLQASQGWLADPNSYFEGPGKSSMDSVLRQLSATHGNPIGSPTAMGIATEAGLKDWRNAVTGLGSLGLGGQGLTAQYQSAAADSAGDRYQAIGSGLANITKPVQSLSDILKSMGFTGSAA